VPEFRPESFGDPNLHARTSRKLHISFRAIEIR
jgi:hypothetical protein